MREQLISSRQLFEEENEGDNGQEEAKGADGRRAAGAVADNQARQRPIQG